MIVWLDARKANKIRNAKVIRQNALCEERAHTGMNANGVDFMTLLLISHSVRLVRFIEFWQRYHSLL